MLNDVNNFNNRKCYETTEVDKLCVLCETNPWSKNNICSSYIQADAEEIVDPPVPQIT